MARMPPPLHPQPAPPGQPPTCGLAGLGVIIVYFYLRFGQTSSDQPGAVQPGVGKGPVTIPLLPMVTPNLNTAEVPGLDAVSIQPKHSPCSPRSHFAPVEPRDGDQIRGMSPGCRTGLARTVPTPRMRIPTLETRSIGTPELEAALQDLRRDIPPFDFSHVLPFRFWLEEVVPSLPSQMTLLRGCNWTGRMGMLKGKRWKNRLGGSCST